MERLPFCNKFYGISEFGFWLNKEARFITEILSNYQWKEHNLFCKTIIGSFKKAPRLRDRHFFI